MAIKELTAGRPANELVPQSPFGKPPYGSGYDSEKDYRTGELVMLADGLYRIKSAETISTHLHIGIPCTISSHGSGSIVFDINQSNKEGGNLGGLAHVFPKDIQVLLGEQGFRATNQIINNKASATSTTAGLLTITTDDAVRTSLFPAGTECTILFIPKNTTAPRSWFLDKRTFAALESPSSDTVVYDLAWGISQHPKYIGADGTLNNAGFVSLNMTEGEIGIDMGGGGTNNTEHMGSSPAIADGSRNDSGIGGETGSSIGGAAHGVGGYGMGMVRYSGMCSPKVRVFQPEAVVRFTSDREKNTQIPFALGDPGIPPSKSGFLDASDTSALSPNPAYKLITGSNGNDGTLPFFQVFQDTLEDLHDPHITIVGMKFILDEVSTEEVRQMIRRSGRFNYKIIQDPTQAYKDLSDGVTGPRNGWKEAVEATKGRSMSFDDYKRLTDNVTSQTMNLLYGTSDQQVAKRNGGDPRQRHRRI
jgi:hypothetical protein